MTESLEDDYRRLVRHIDLSEKMVNVFFSVDSNNSIIVKNLEFFLNDKIKQNKNFDNNETNENIQEIKLLDLSYFEHVHYYENSKNLLTKLENNVFIIDCTQCMKEDNFKSLNQLSSFYYLAKKIKTTFIYAFESVGFREGGVIMEAYQMRNFSFNIDSEDLKTYRLFKEISAKYVEKNIKEKKNKI